MPRYAASGPLAYRPRTGCPWATLAHPCLAVTDRWTWSNVSSCAGVRVRAASVCGNFFWRCNPSFAHPYTVRSGELRARAGVCEPGYGNFYFWVALPVSGEFPDPHTRTRPHTRIG